MHTFISQCIECGDQRFNLLLPQINCVQITHRIGQNSTGNLASVAFELTVWVRLTCILYFLHIKKHQHLRLGVRDLGGESAGYLIQGFTPAKYVAFH